VLSPTLPPRRFHPVAAEFVTGSISAPGLFEAMEYGLARDHPLEPVYVYRPAGGGAAEPAINLSIMHGVRSSLELQRTGDFGRALAASNPEVAPHLSFVDVGGHGYAVVRVAPEDLTVEFVCIPRPLERASGTDGGPLAYRVSHRVRLWPSGGTPAIERVAREGTLPLVS
jgi:alkaline phosphatase D